MDAHQQRVHFLVALLQVPAGALAQWVADSDSAVSTTLTRLLATSLEPDPDPVRHDNLRPLLHAVIARLVAHPKSNIPVPLLALYSHAFLESNYTLVTRNVIPDALASSPKLAQELRATCGPALIEALRLGGGGDGDLLRSHVVLSLIRATAHAGPLGPIVPQLVQTLNEAYPPLVSPAAGTDHPGLRRLRLAVLETAHDLVRVAASGATVPAVEALESVLSHLLVASTPSSTTTTTTMLARDLVSMYEPLGAELAKAVQGAVGPVARNVKDQIARLRRLPAAATSSLNEKKEEAEWLADLRANALGGAADPAAVGTARDREEPVTAAAGRESHAHDGADPARILSKADTEADLAQVRPPNSLPLLFFPSQSRVPLMLTDQLGLPVPRPCPLSAGRRIAARPFPFGIAPIPPRLPHRPVFRFKCRSFWRDGEPATDDRTSRRGPVGRGAVAGTVAPDPDRSSRRRRRRQ